MKKCPHCGATKSLDQFYPDQTRPDGRKAWCKVCMVERARVWRKNNRDKAREYARNWAEKNPEKVREKSRRTDARRALKRHDGPAERARMLAEQGGCCFMCKRPFRPDDKIHVDHDHDCCPSYGRTDSCRNCRRGLAHEVCNLLVGMCGEDMDLLRAIAANFEPVRDATRVRVAAAKAEQLEIAL